ncbi:MAG: hypothetical protein JW894_12125 [Bacteroidales bacterium]|nr:hypothetical protein [Bacteroidales bacterium]
MKTAKIHSCHLTLILLISCISLTFSQTAVIRSINYKQISNFETEYYICSMKISADGSTIVFGTSGPAVKVFTVSSTDSDLTQVYDFERTGTGPTVDISNNGDKIIWCDGYGEIFIANSDGSELEEIATLLPNPNPEFADIEPTINLTPRITSTVGQVYFLVSYDDPYAAGLWRVGADGSDNNTTL